MTTTIGSIESFDSAQGGWNAYYERFEQYVIANEIKDEKKIVAVFLTSIGSTTYNLLRDLKSPAKPSEFKLADLADTLRNHFSPKSIIIAEQFHFHKREQHEGEGVADYCAALKKCSERCEFGTFLEEALRDRFVCGLRSKQAQKKLLAESKLTWQKALEIATAMESAEKQANQFRTQGTPVNVNAMPARFTKDKKKTQKEQKPCFRCSGSHAPQVCRFKDERCRYCQFKGHIEKVCRKKAASTPTGRDPPTHSHGKKSVKMVEIENDGTEQDEFKLFKVDQVAPEPSILIPLFINGSKMSMELDTGASVSVMSNEAWRKLKTST